MQNIISRSVLIHKKFIARCSQYEMILYNEKPRTCTSVVVSFDEDKNEKAFQSNGVKTIRSNDSKTLRSTDTSYVILHTNTVINIPVIEKSVKSEGMPVITVVDVLKWLAKSEDTGNKDSVQTGARLGRLDAANEAGFFHRTDRSRLKEIKKKLKNKPETEPTEKKKT